MDLLLNAIYYLLFISSFYIMGEYVEKKQYAKAGLSFAIGLGLFVLWIGPLEINITNHIYSP